MNTQRKRLDLLASIVEGALQATEEKKRAQLAYLFSLSEGTLRALPDLLRDDFVKNIAKEVGDIAKAAGLEINFHDQLPKVLVAIRQQEAHAALQAQKERAVSELIQSAFAISTSVGYAVKYALKPVTLFEDPADPLPMAAHQPACCAACSAQPQQAQQQ